VDIIKKEKILLIIDNYKELLDFKEIIPISALRGTNLDILEDKIYEYLPKSKTTTREQVLHLLPPLSQLSRSW